MTETVMVLLAGFASGTLNAVGGGGTFVALPALVAFGVPPVAANVISRIALTPGALAAAWVCRAENTQVGTVSTRALTATSLVGGGFGAGLLLVLPSSLFDAAVPWLLAFATLLLATGGRLPGLLRKVSGRAVPMSPRAVVVGQFALAVYGGYFGGAVGILMLALWSAGLGLDAATSNPMRVAQLGAVYLGAACVFLFVPDARGSPVVLTGMLAGALAGGFAGAHLTRRLPASVLRGTVLTVAASATALYFLGL